MTDEAADNAVTAEDETVEELDATAAESEEQQAGGGEEQPVDDNANLMKALRAERKLRREAEKRANELANQQELKQMPDGEQEIERIRREAEAAAISKANQRVVRAEFKYAAKGKVLNPDLAIRAIDFSDIEVDEDGNVDADSLGAAIDEFLEAYPDQKVQGRAGFGETSIGARVQPGTSEPTAHEIARDIRV